MRLSTSKTDLWELRSGELANSQNPNTFWIPPLEERQNMQRGQAVRLFFDIEVENEEGKLETVGERMRVIVSEKVGDTYIGILDNQPTCSDLRAMCTCGLALKYRFARNTSLIAKSRHKIMWIGN